MRLTYRPIIWRDFVPHLSNYLLRFFDSLPHSRIARCYHGFTSHSRTPSQLACFPFPHATGWVPSILLPSTVAAAWSKPSGGTPIIIAFACTCVGKKKYDMNAARRLYVSSLRTLSQNCVTGAGKMKENPHNRPGNCPEFVAWGAICNDEGAFRSLCLNILREVSYKCCIYCENLAKGAWENKKILIEDWFDKTSFKNGKAEKFEGGYQGCPIKNVELIIREGRGRRYDRNRRNGGAEVENDIEGMRMEVDEVDGEFEGERMQVDWLVK